MPTTKIYYNTTDEPINVVGLDEVAPHDIVSITTEFQPPVVLANYPGLVDITETGLTSSNATATPVVTKGDATNE